MLHYINTFELTLSATIGSTLNDLESKILNPVGRGSWNSQRYPLYSHLKYLDAASCLTPSRVNRTAQLLVHIGAMK
ncbi:uncharacterized protein N7458_004323 [Penicillium daleae]|uniref:Uncharacterized protein n=1 Tax=Penicillium daleae TaxID=63821 RepID=A0AAD6C9Z6_9EURO|nr:uncharacterized protein N7458_004323 [Penicillium daleae]KAJ5456059.1 hypothetical protein N7458_004323 [Penicillium daleae]